MAQIKITRSSGKVMFQTISIDVTENVFFTNLDSQAHWPTLSANQVGSAPSPNSSQCIVPPPGNLLPPANQVKYTCKLHPGEQGIVNVFDQLAATSNDDQDPPPPPIILLPATKGQPITAQQVVEGGMSPYAISGEIFQVTDNTTKKVIYSGPASGLGLKLNPDPTGSAGITLSGTPNLSGTYNFTFTVNDAMGKNLQQVQYSMTVN